MLWKEAEQFITLCYTELGKNDDEIYERLQQVKREIEQTGTYEHTYEELEHGARMAWRNSNRCIGRLFWQTLHVFDARTVEREEDVVERLFDHIMFATNGGKIRPTITIFCPERVRIWNHQLIRYAGYETEHGMIGDPSSISFTKACEQLGWRGERTHFDILPLVIQVDGREPKLFPIPKDIVLEVPIEHPTFSWFRDLQLKWYAVTIISDMCL